MNEITLFLMKKIQNLRKIILLIMFFAIEFFFFTNKKNEGKRFCHIWRHSSVQSIKRLIQHFCKKLNYRK